MNASKTERRYRWAAYAGSAIVGAALGVYDIDTVTAFVLIIAYTAVAMLGFLIIVVVEMRAAQQRAIERIANTNTYVDGTNQMLHNVHSPDVCAGEHCTIHNPSNHLMSSWPTHYRFDRGFMERMCAHGVGHPDPDDPHADPVHGCDGCCTGRYPLP